ncbi:hypothetical protein AB0M57_20345 [Streptomyces sp. NPDC051597]
MSLPIGLAAKSEGAARTFGMPPSPHSAGSRAWRITSRSPSSKSFRAWP